MPTTIAEFVANVLTENGFDTLYCLPGIQNDDFFDVLFDRQDQIYPLHTRHEQGAAYMAMGAALATGKKQAFCVVPGPGFLNTAGALSTAWAVNAPLLVISGQIPEHAIGRDYGILHDVPDQLATMRTLTKRACRLTPENTVNAMRELLDTLQSGRPRPVGFEVPVDVWKKPLAGENFNAHFPPPANPALDADAIEQATHLLTGAKAPMIVVGSGALDASAEVTRLAEMLSAPVVMFRTGRGVVSSHHDLALNLPAGHALWPKVDVVVAIGTRLHQQQMVWGVDDDLKIIHIDIDQTETGRINAPDVTINANATDAVAALTLAIEGHEQKRGQWLGAVADARAVTSARFRDVVAPQLAWMDAIRAELPDDGILVEEMTQIGYVARMAYPTLKPRTFLSTGYQGTLGFGIATGLGAAHARRDVPVVSITGDGGALFTIAELASAVRHNIPLTVIVFTDNAYGNVRRFQIDKFNNRTIASDLANPDFVKFAESFGISGRRANSPDQLRACLNQAFRNHAPALIEVPVGDFPAPWEFYYPPKVRGV